jgi:hypothetical protein
MSGKQLYESHTGLIYPSVKQQKTILDKNINSTLL